jgi:hypothetical protein
MTLVIGDITVSVDGFVTGAGAAPEHGSGAEATQALTSRGGDRPPVPVSGRSSSRLGQIPGVSGIR